MLKTIFNCKIFWLSCLAGLLLPLAVRAAPSSEAGRSTQRVAQVVDYVAADYPGAVKNGSIIEESEYKEQLELLSEARKQLGELSGDPEAQKALAKELDAVVAAVENKAEPGEVLARCRKVRERLKSAFGLRLSPTGTLDAGRGATLFQSLCASCHGADGRAETPMAKALKPRPVSFLDGERMAQVSPSLAFHTLTFGVQGTGMAAFDHLPAHDRWNLAFYVVALRHGRPGAAASLPAAVAEKLAAAQPLTSLAERSDGELLAELAAAQVADPTQALAYLRTSAPYQEKPQAGGRFAEAERLLTAVAEAAERGDYASAHKLAIAAYLDGIEPHEAALRVSQPESVRRIEAAFQELRQVTDSPSAPSAATVQAKVRATRALLADVERAGQGSQVKALAGALLIAVREGLEIALLIAALLAFLRKSGQAALARYVHLGWLLAVPAGLITFAAVGAVIDGARRELAEGILTLFAAAMLLTVTHWVLGARESKQWLGFLRKKVEAAGETGAGRGQILALVGIAFFAAYREALETVLFFRALMLQAGPGGQGQVLLGAGLGTLLMIGLVLVVGRIGKKLNPRPVMLASSVLLAALSLTLTGHGLHALQEGGYVRSTPVVIAGEAWSGLPSIGLYASWQGLALQALVLVLLLLPSLLDKLRASKDENPPSFAQPTRA